MRRAASRDLPKVNFVMRGQLDPFGMALSSAGWLHALQEQVIHECGVASPMERLQAEAGSTADMSERVRYREFRMGRIRDFEMHGANDIVLRDIANKAWLEELPGNTAKSVFATLASTGVFS